MTPTPLAATLLRPGQTVRIGHHDATPDGLRGAAAVVESIEPWGAHVRCVAAGSGRYRALFAELVPAAPEPPRPRPSPTGEVCDRCGGANMIRAGACMVCADCGTSSGCG
jgi:hypothetical protein